MAYLRRRGKRWQAIVRVKGGEPVSGSFDTKREAELWAQAQEQAIRSGARGQFPAKTVEEALTRYMRDVASQKRTELYEVARLEAFCKDFPDLASLQFSAFDKTHVTAWRDQRLKKVKPSTVQRDVNLLRYVWNIGAREWKWTGTDNPWSRLRIPGHIESKSSIWGWRQIRAMLRRMGYFTGSPPMTKSEEVAYAFLVALRTGLRQGEILGLTAERVDTEKRVLRLDIHKTLEKVGVRHVPMTKRAARLLSVLKRANPTGPLFTVNSAEALFRKYKHQLRIKGPTFHDSRATFATHQARRVDVLTLAKILGHADPKQTLVYYRESAEDMAARIG